MYTECRHANSLLVKQQIRLIDNRWLILVNNCFILCYLWTADRETLPYDHSCNNSGHPSKAGLSLVSIQPMHIPRYVAAKTAELQLYCVMSFRHVASTICLAM